MKKRILPALLALVMVLAMLPLSVFALPGDNAAPNIAAYGYSGKTADGKVDQVAIATAVNWPTSVNPSQDYYPLNFWVVLDNWAKYDGWSYGIWVQPLTDASGNAVTSDTADGSKTVLTSDTDTLLLMDENNFTCAGSMDGNMYSATLQSCKSFKFALLPYKFTGTSGEESDATKYTLGDTNGLQWYTIERTDANQYWLVNDVKLDEKVAALDNLVAANASSKSIQYKVTFAAGDGTGTAEPQYVAVGGKPTLPTDFTKSGYTLSGWKNGATDWDTNSTVTEPVTLTAQWTADAPAAPTFTAVPQNATMYTKTVSAFQGSDIEVGALSSGKYPVTGTVKYVESWLEFNQSVVGEQKGFYVALSIPGSIGTGSAKAVTGMKLPAEGGTKTKEYTGQALTNAFTDSGNCYTAFFLGATEEAAKAKTITISLKYDGDADYTDYAFSFAGLTYTGEPSDTVVTPSVTPTTDGDKVSASANVNEADMTSAITAAASKPAADKVVTVAISDEDTTLTAGSAIIAKDSVSSAVTNEVAVKVDVADVGSVELNKAALTAVQNAIGAEANATVSVETAADVDDAVPATQEAVKTFEVTVTVNSQPVDNWTGANGGIKLSFYVGTTLTNPKLYLVEGTTATQIPGAAYDGTSGIITATVDHLSTYMVTQDEAPTEYNITITSPTNGTVTTSPATKTTAGSEVTITATPSAGYKIGAITVKDADNAVVPVADSKFTMPAKNVTVTVTFVLDVNLTYTAPVTGTTSFGKINLTGLTNNGHYVMQLVKTGCTSPTDYTIVEINADGSGQGSVWVLDNAAGYDVQLFEFDGSKVGNPVIYPAAHVATRT